MRYLTCSLFAEGRSDAIFLADVLTRQLRELLWRNETVEVGAVLAEERRTVADHVLLDPEVLEAAGFADLVFVHHDGNEAGKIDALRLRLGERLPDRVRLIGLVPRRETEAWCLADPRAFALIPGAETALLPRKPAEVEKIFDPKAELARVLPTRRVDDALQVLGANIALDRLAEVPAYQSFLHDLTAALKELNFL